MGQLTEDMIRKIAHFRSDTVDAMLADLNAHEDVDAVSASGACSLTIKTTELTVSGTKAYTLAAPTRTGQRKVIRCVSAASVPAGTLTVSSPDDTTGFVCAASFFFDTVGQEIELEATAALKWRCVRKKRAGRKTLVIGTTVTTGICNMSHVNVTVDGTVASSVGASKGLPNGSAIGEICSVTCSAAINTPHGDLGGSFIADDGTTAKVQLDDFTAATDYALLSWNGTAWELMAMQGSTLALA